jgi:hypothetical protein
LLAVALLCWVPPAGATGSAPLTVIAKPLRPAEAGQLPAIEVLVYGASASQCAVRVVADDDERVFGGLTLGTRGGGAWYWQVASGRPASGWDMTVRCRTTDGETTKADKQTVNVKRSPGPYRDSEALIAAGSLYTDSDVSNSARMAPPVFDQVQHAGIGGLNVPTLAVSR